MANKEEILERALQGFLEHVEWVGPPFETPSEDKTYLIVPGARGSLIQVGRNRPGVFGLQDESVGPDEVLLFFEGSLLVRVPLDGPWRPYALPEKHAITSVLDSALRQFVETEASLLRSDASERNLTTKLAERLQDALPDWHVDSEHNRMAVPGSDVAAVKRITMWLAWVEKYAHDNSLGPVANVFPDIIVHRRESCCNLLVIEVKKQNIRDVEARKATDINKLVMMQSQLGYKHAAFILLNTGPQFGVAEVIWLPDALATPGGPLCYVRYLDGDFLFQTSSGKEPTRVVKPA